MDPRRPLLAVGRGELSRSDHPRLSGRHRTRSSAAITPGGSASTGKPLERLSTSCRCREHRGATGMPRVRPPTVVPGATRQAAARPGRNRIQSAPNQPAAAADANPCAPSRCRRAASGRDSAARARTRRSCLKDSLLAPAWVTLALNSRTCSCLLRIESGRCVRLLGRPVPQRTPVRRRTAASQLALQPCTRRAMRTTQPDCSIA